MRRNVGTDSTDSCMCANGSLAVGFMNKVSV